MSGFDTFVIVDWSAGKRAPERPSKDAIWIGVVQAGSELEPVYCRARADAESWLSDFISSEARANRRVFIGFDFPFGYPSGFVRRVTGSNNPLVFWDWLEGRITDSDLGENNRFEVRDLSRPDIAIEPCDEILMLDVLHHLPRERHEEMLRTCYEALRPGGEENAAVLHA